MVYTTVAIILGILLAIGATVVLYILVMPEKNKEKLNEFFKVVRSIFNFDKLLLEKILKVLYAFSTLACIIVGFLLLFSFSRDYSFYSGYERTSWNGWIGLLIMILGPIIVRISYEYMLLFVFGVSRLMSIDNKIPGNCDGKGGESPAKAAPEPDAPVAPSAPVYEAPTEPAPAPASVYETPAEPTPAPVYEAPAEPAPAPAPEPVYRYCTKCGTKYDITKGGCPNGCQ